MKRQWYYRGNIKSCNYKCSYCPFSKKKMLSSELEKDKTAFFRFVQRANDNPLVEGAVFITPYGEALIHSYYWEGLAHLSRNPRLDAIGAQSNFSFPIKKMVDTYLKHDGTIHKLRLWGTFHPQMTTVENFANQCEILDAYGIAHSVGVVGVPAQIPDIQKLREALPASTYLWINKMDGLGRNYTEAEIAFFTNIDSNFPLELAHYKADINRCSDNRFVEADGSIRRCNISRQVLGNFYTLEDNVTTTPCRCRECSCYLAYCNISLKELEVFGAYPAFRVPTTQ